MAAAAATTVLSRSASASTTQVVVNRQTAPVAAGRAVVRVAPSARAVLRTAGAAQPLHARHSGSASRRPRRVRASASVSEETEKKENDDVSGVETQEPVAPGASKGGDLLQRVSQAVQEGNVDDAVVQETTALVDAELAALENTAANATAKATNLEAELSKTKDALVRLTADFDNFRKRSAREKDDMRVTVKGDVIESLLPMMDLFQLAKNSVKVENEREEKIANSYQSIYTQVLDIMKKLGLEQVPTAGQPFNPEVHDAIMREPSDQYPEDTVIEEFRAGYTNNGRLLRPAMVKVSMGPAEPAAEEAAQEEASA
eukprot:jgi/Chlat1/8262/Chrsp78S07691